MAEGQAFWDQLCIKLPGVWDPKAITRQELPSQCTGWVTGTAAELTPTIDSQLHLPGGIACSIGGSAHVFPALFSPRGHHIQASI